jgi:hypothetical protein
MTPRIAAYLLFVVTTLSMPAQSVIRGSSAETQFSDPKFGVSFHYPASWTISASQPFYMQLAISPELDVPNKDRLRALIYTKSLANVVSWPKTHFEGVEFGYDAHSVPTADACHALANPENGEIEPVDDVTMGGHRYWHIKEGNAGLGHSMGEDVYTLYSSGKCLRFDLAVSQLDADLEGVPQRAITSHEQSLIDASLRDILTSVRITRPSQ